MNNAHCIPIGEFLISFIFVARKIKDLLRRITIGQFDCSNAVFLPAR